MVRYKPPRKKIPEDLATMAPTMLFYHAIRHYGISKNTLRRMAAEIGVSFKPLTKADKQAYGARGWKATAERHPEKMRCGSTTRANEVRLARQRAKRLIKEQEEAQRRLEEEGVVYIPRETRPVFGQGGSWPDMSKDLWTKAMMRWSGGLVDETVEDCKMSEEALSA